MTINFCVVKYVQFFFWSTKQSNLFAIFAIDCNQPFVYNCIEMSSNTQSVKMGKMFFIDFETVYECANIT